MRRLTPLLVLCLAAFALAFAGCGDNQGDAAGGTANTGASTEGNAGGGSGDVKVSMKDILFKPETVTVKVGQKIVWTNDDPIPHTVTAKKGADFDSGDVSSGKTYEYTAEKAGTIEYYCKIHPNQKGKIVVS